MENLRFIDGDNCRTLSADGRTSTRYESFRDPSFFAPLLALNGDEWNPKGVKVALNHALEYRAPAIHRHLLTDTDSRGIIRRLFGKLENGSVEHSETSARLADLYESYIPDAEKLQTLQDAWRSKVPTPPRDISQSLEQNFTEAKNTLKNTLSGMTKAEQAAIDYLGVEFVLMQETSRLDPRDINFARPATRSVFLKKADVERFESVWEECFHLLIAYTLGDRNRPASAEIEDWKTKHPDALGLLEQTRKSVMPNNQHYAVLSKGRSTPLDKWEELIVDCARYKRLNAQTSEEMQQKFGLLWEHTGIVEQEMSFIAEMPAGTEKNTAIQSLFEMRNREFLNRRER